jgi:uncharacterized protein YjeT (DUF2065 family)
MATDEAGDENGQVPEVLPELRRRVRKRLGVWLLGWVCVSAVAVVLSAIWWPGPLVGVVTVAIAGIGVVTELVVENLPAEERTVARALIKSAFRLYFLSLGLFALPPVAYGLVRNVSAAENSLLRRAGLTVVALGLVAALWLMHRDWLRRYLARKSWFFSLWVYVGTVVTSAAALFAGVTWELYQANLVELSPAPASSGSLVDFYMYYLADAIPGSITETLRWEPPFEYVQHRMGALVLVFALTVAYPVVTFVADQRRRKRPVGPVPT